MNTINQKLRSVELCLSAHPHNEPDSEFADRISDLQEIQPQISELLKQRNDMREMLKYLHNVGGQGFEIHDRIEKLLESTNP